MDNAKNVHRSAPVLSKDDSSHTAKEIERQPALWKLICQSWEHEKRIGTFLEPLLGKDGLEIVLTGAGSSAFIGDAVHHSFFLNFGRRSRSISTTTLVTNFKNYIDPARPLLLISFARSGNSPESTAVIHLAEALCREVYHVAITCNPAGKLALEVNGLDRGLTLLLPPEADDKGLAMTGSFTGMLLTALLLSEYRKGIDSKDLVQRTAHIAEELLGNETARLKDIASLPFSRIVFLGSGPMTGIARESHLKVQELTNGRVIGKFDSFLGFRHGPKAVIDDRTLMVYLFSSDDHIFRYEADLARQIGEEGTPLKTLGVFSSPEQAAVLDSDGIVLGRDRPGAVPPDYLLPVCVIPAQILGFYKCLQQDLNPDNPSENGSISRVVQGVRIYPHSD